jgi:hypothetical protein
MICHAIDLDACAIDPTDDGAEVFVEICLDSLVINGRRCLVLKTMW